MTTRESLAKALAGGVVKVLVFPDIEGVVLPPFLARERFVRLDLSWNFIETDVDMVLDATGVSATLRFDGGPFRVHLPWNAVHVLPDTKLQPKRPALRLVN